MCFRTEQSPPRTAEEQLEWSRVNAAAYTPRALDLTKFKASPFVARSLRTAAYVYVRDDRLGKPGLAPKYTGPHRVKERNWSSNTFLLDLGGREDNLSLSRLKAGSVPPDAK